MGVCDETPQIEAGRASAKERGWTFDVREGNMGLLKKLFAGPWDEDFIIVPPGHRIVARNDEWVLDQERP
jgi:hypothetical protein